LGKRTFIRWSGFALILWALHLLVRDFIWAVMHGTTEAAMGDTFLGLTTAQYSVLWTPFALLGLFGLGGVYVQVSHRLSKTGKAGFFVAFLGLALSFISAVMQSASGADDLWGLDREAYFRSPLVQGGWLLSIAAVFVLTAGLVVAGIAIQRADALPQGRTLNLTMGILLLPTALLVGYLVAHSDGSLVSKLLYGGLSVPYDLCWLWLGLLLLNPAIERGRSNGSASRFARMH
jgi:hypothetical protein